MWDTGAQEEREKISDFIPPGSDGNAVPGNMEVDVRNVVCAVRA